MTLLQCGTKAWAGYTRMGQLWMYDAPLVFWGLWKVRVPAATAWDRLKRAAQLLA